MRQTPPTECRGETAPALPTTPSPHQTRPTFCVPQTPCRQSAGTGIGGTDKYRQPQGQGRMTKPNGSAGGDDARRRGGKP